MVTDRFRQMLLDRRKALEELSRISAGSRSAVELDQTKVGRVSRIDAMQQQEMAKATEAQRSAELRKIAAALERVEAGDYGYCIDCDEPIAPKRLEIDPATALCIDCAGR
jgi:DnaK suppressor protein